MNNILLKAGIKRHRGGLTGIFVLMFLVSLVLAEVLTLWNNSSQYVTKEIQRAGFGALAAWVSGLPSPMPLADEIAAIDAVERVETQAVLYTGYELNGQESDSEGQLILYIPEENRYRFFTDDLSGYRPQPEAIAPGEVYLSPSMASMMDAKIGDTLTVPIARGGKNLLLTIAGWY